MASSEILEIDRRRLAGLREIGRPLPEPKPQGTRRRRDERRVHTDPYAEAMRLLNRLGWAIRDEDRPTVAALERRIDGLLGVSP